MVSVNDFMGMGIKKNDTVKVVGTPLLEDGVIRQCTGKYIWPIMNGKKSTITLCDKDGKNMCFVFPLKSVEKIS